MGPPSRSRKEKTVLWIDLLFVLAVALLIASLFGMGGREYAAGLDLLAFFPLVFFGTWALGAWFRPIGPPVMGGYWVPYLIAGVVIALLLMAGVVAAAAGRRERTLTHARDELKAGAAAAAVFGVFFWVFLLASLVAIVAAYLSALD
jgi:hypothetical protein